MLSCANFGNEAGDLHNTIEAMARKPVSFSYHYVDSLTTIGLIPQATRPECRSIGVREVLLRIVSKCIMAVVKDVRMTEGNLQVCAGQQVGREAAVHAMQVFNHVE